MKQLIITIEKIEGQLELEYDSNGVLRALKNDLNGLTETQLKYVAGNFGSEEMLQRAKEQMGTTLKVQEMQREVSFEEFYAKYNYKKKKLEAERAWKRMSKSVRWQAYNYIGAYESDLIRHPRGKMYPATYLNQKPWLD